MSMYTKSAVGAGGQKISKREAIELVRRRGYVLGNFVTFASKNTTVGDYWANPASHVLQKDWSLILNDWVNHTLYIFQIPGRVLSDNDLKYRADKNDIIDLQIYFANSSFVDSRSGVSFAPFLAGEIAY